MGIATYFIGILVDGPDKPADYQLVLLEGEPYPNMTFSSTPAEGQGQGQNTQVWFHEARIHFRVHGGVAWGGIQVTAPKSQIRGIIIVEPSINVPVHLTLSHREEIVQQCELPPGESEHRFSWVVASTDDVDAQPPVSNEVGVTARATPLLRFDDPAYHVIADPDDGPDVAAGAGVSEA